MTTRNAQSDHANTLRFLRRLQSVMPPWGVSLALHVVLFLLLLVLVPTAHRLRSASGDRVTENVGIVFAPATSGGTASQSSVASLPEQVAQPSVADIVSQHLDELVPQQPAAPLAVIGPSQSPGSPSNANSASGSPSGAVGSESNMLSASFMGAQGTGRKFVYVLDRSNSTGYGQRRSPLYVAKTELLASLQSIGETSLRESKPIQFQVIFFNHETAVFNMTGTGGSDKAGRLLRYDQTMLDKVQRFLGGVIPDGGTKPEPALMQAIRMGADCIFFMTDGSTQLTPAQRQRIRDMAKGVQINVVEYGTGPSRSRNNSLRQLAIDHHGHYVYVDLSQRPR
ncbi:MAG: hypothetical protein FWH27_02795 [Planctomycetaceae bacterium]|nr:hypothetical protein [Planctomycetaceae bacterium]